jgi:hypothetical protein
VLGLDEKAAPRRRKSEFIEGPFECHLNRWNSERARLKFVLCSQSHHATHAKIVSSHNIHKKRRSQNISRRTNRFLQVPSIPCCAGEVVGRHVIQQLLLLKQFFMILDVAILETVWREQCEGLFVCLAGSAGGPCSESTDPAAGFLQTRDSRAESDSIVLMFR